MLCLSVRPPCSWFIIRPDLTGEDLARAIARREVKDFENRTWKIPKKHTLPFRCAIHASKTFDPQGYRWVCQKLPRVALFLPEPEDFDYGGIIGTVDIVACVTRSDSPWFTGPYGFVLANPRACTFMPMTGRMGFFEVTGLEKKISA